VSLKFGILGLLAVSPLHGYDVKQRFESLLGGSWEVNIGQVYTTLQRLERDGLVEPAGERGDRRRLAYQLTDAGRAALNEWLQQPESEPQLLRDSIYMKLLLASRLGDGSLGGLLARQRRVYLQRLRDLAGLEESARTAGRDDLVLLYRGAVFHTEADLKWVDACLDEMRTLRSAEGGEADGRSG
jgi:DNA-binding PadR family transcriptional regulator